MEQSAGQGQALLHPLAVVANSLVGPVRQTEVTQQRGEALRNLVRQNPEKVREDCQVFSPSKPFI